MSAELVQPELYDMPKPESLRDQLEFERLHNRSVAIDGNAFTLYSPGNINLPQNGYFSVLGELRLAEGDTADAALIRERHDGENTFSIIGLDKDEAGRTTYNGHYAVLQPGREVSIGRDPAQAEGLWDAVDTHVSRNHLTISVSGDAIYIKDHSSNGTEIARGKRPQEKQLTPSNEGHRANYTSRANMELLRLESESSAQIEERDGEVYVDGRVTIGRDTEIHHERPGIDIRSWRVGGESIVVDSKKYPEQYNKLMSSYEKKLRRLTRGGLVRANEETKLRAVFETVSGALNYNLNYVQAWEDIKTKQPKENMRKIGLNVYLEAGEGVCRHMALAVGWLGGELARRGELSGKTTTGANVRTSDNSGHEWARYTADDGTVYILDPARKHFGKLTDFMDDKKVWEYFRPGERAKYDALLGKGDIDPSNVVFKPGEIKPRIWK